MADGRLDCRTRRAARLAGILPCRQI